MSFSNIEMIHLYIYFKQENAKKNLCFFCCCFFVFVLRKTQLWENYYSRRNASSGSHVHIGKTVSSDVSGNYLIKRLPSGNAKIFVSCIGFQSVDTLVNIAFDEVLNFALLENTVQLQEVVIRQKSIH
jgi:iron complex outermembrane receptor protein